MLFVAVDIAGGAIMKAWLVPSIDYASVLGSPNSRGRHRFHASMKAGSKDRWVDYRLEAAELAPKILARLSALEAQGAQ